MCTSAHQFNGDFVRFVQEKKPKIILDLGTGIGKYGKLLKDSGIGPYRLTGVEINETFEERLQGLYDRIVWSDLVKYALDYSLTPHNMEKTWDLVIMGDVLEHLRKSEGIDIIEFYVYRSTYLYIQFPLFMIQFSGGVHARENHVSIWADRDFDRFVHDYQEISGIARVIIEGRKVKP